MLLGDDLSVALARLGMAGRNAAVAIRPVLLRVAVDQFVQKRHHAPEDLRLFQAMVEPLLEQTNADTRRLLAERLFDHPQTPAGLLDRLMQDEALVAADTYLHAALPDEELISAAATGPAMVAAVLAQRPDLPADVVHALARRPERRVLTALATNRAIILSPGDLLVLIGRARADRDLAELIVANAADLSTVTALFPLVSADQRRRIVDALRREALGRRQWARPDRATSALIHRLDQLALSGEWDGFDHTLCVALGCEDRRLRPLLHDGSGDMLALALAAAGVSSEVAARVFILGDPSIGTSVASVRRLTKLVETIAPSAAKRLIESVLGYIAPAVRRHPVPAAPLARPEPAPAPARRDAVETPRRARG